MLSGARCYVTTGRLQLAKHLLSLGPEAGPRLDVLDLSQDGMSVLHAAADAGDAALVRMPTCTYLTYNSLGTAHNEAITATEDDDCR